MRRPLTHDEHKAAEAAFRALPLNRAWSTSAQAIYHGIVGATQGRNVVDEALVEEESGACLAEEVMVP